MCVIVVLGGGYGDHSFSAYRISEAIRLFKNGLCNKLLLVGNKLEVEYMLAKARSEGIVDGLFFDDNSEDTIDNAYYSKLIITKLNEKEIVLVTSAFHMDRAYKVFSKIYGPSFRIIKHSVKCNPGKNVLIRENKLKKLLPILDLFPDGDHELIWDVAKKIKGVLNALLE